MQRKLMDHWQAAFTDAFGPDVKSGSGWGGGSTRIGTAPAIDTHSTLIMYSLFYLVYLIWATCVNAKNSTAVSGERVGTKTVAFDSERHAQC